MNRRKFLTHSVTCGAHLLALSVVSPAFARSVFAIDDKKILAKEKWARIEKIHDGVFGVISTPFDSRDFTTVCNGGIIVGDKGVLVVEAYMQKNGASWVEKQTEALCKAKPTDVVLTHYHGDHASGHKGFGSDKVRPKIWLTDATKDAAEESFKKQSQANEFENVQKLDGKKPTEIDLGNRKVKIVPRMGHTQSDVTIELVDPKVVFCGDLFFNRMFPNYLDATPTVLKKYVAEMSTEKDVTHVPGHGPISTPEDMNKYRDFLAFVEKSASDAFAAGKSSVEASKEFKLPKSMEDWMIWSPTVVQRSYDAWYRELKK